MLQAYSYLLVFKKIVDFSFLPLFVGQNHFIFKKVLVSQNVFVGPNKKIEKIEHYIL